MSYFMCVFIYHFIFLSIEMTSCYKAILTENLSVRKIDKSSWFCVRWANKLFLWDVFKPVLWYQFQLVIAELIIFRLRRIEFFHLLLEFFVFFVMGCFNFAFLTINLPIDEVNQSRKRMVLRANKLILCNMLKYVTFELF